MAKQNKLLATSWRSLLFAALTLLLAADSQAQPAPVNSAVIINNRETLLAAPEVVERIAALGEDRVMFVVTLHCRLTPDLRPIELGLIGGDEESRQESRDFSRLHESLLVFYRERLTVAFGKAVEHGMDIAVLPHFDAAGDVTEWRNLFDFDPLEEFAGYSYQSAVIDSCLAAIKATASEETRIDFSLAGEMGRSVFAHPDSYRKLRAHIKSQLPNQPLAIGVSLNHNGLAGDHKPTPEQVEELQGLLNECDFVGLSNYGPFEPPPTVNKFTADCARFLAELESFGLQVPAQTPLHFSEIGLGGAPGRRGATSVERAAAKPWEGTNRSGRNPWVTEPMIAMRRSYHEALLEFLQAQPGPRRVEAAYFWSEGSWEPLGVDQRAFADEEIVKSIREHNEQIRGGS